MQECSDATSADNSWLHFAVKEWRCSCYKAHAAHLPQCERVQSHGSSSWFQPDAAGRVSIYAQMCWASVWLYILWLFYLEQWLTHISIRIYFGLGVQMWWKKWGNWSFIFKTNNTKNRAHTANKKCDKNGFFPAYDVHRRHDTLETRKCSTPTLWIRMSLFPLKFTV